MADDVVLTSFCLLSGYSDALNKEFVSGAQEMKMKIKNDPNGKNQIKNDPNGKTRN
jgi:hypothetical protein